MKRVKINRICSSLADILFVDFLVLFFPPAGILDHEQEVREIGRVGQWGAGPSRHYCQDHWSKQCYDDWCRKRGRGLGHEHDFGLRMWKKKYGLRILDLHHGSPLPHPAANTVPWAYKRQFHRIASCVIFFFSFWLGNQLTGLPSWLSG